MAQTEQEHRKSVEKQLRDTVKRMSADLEGGLKTLEDRLRHLQRVVERFLNHDEDEQLQRDVGGFMKQTDATALVSDRPARAAVMSSISSTRGAGSGYMLSRYFSERSMGGVEGQSRSALKSMQHFLLQWSIIEQALQAWKERLLAESSDGAGHAIDKKGLGNALRFVTVHLSKSELDDAFADCLSKAQQREGDGQEGGLDLDTVSVRDIITSMSVWEVVMVRAPCCC